jgi:hypothetical protein
MLSDEGNVQHSLFDPTIFFFCADIVAIFSNIEELYEINKALLSSLVAVIPVINELAADDTLCPQIGDVFLRHLNKFSGYNCLLRPRYIFFSKFS